MRAFGFAAAVLILSGGGAAPAGTPFPRQMKCAVGGETFTHIDTASYSTWGSRPDGKPYGSWTFPSPLPVCPKNGLVMFKDFSRAELATLPGLIGSAEYRALAKETPYYRAAWLARALEPSAEDPAWYLLQASWEADETPERRARYQREFVDAVTTGPKPADTMERDVLQLRAANALRELGRFEEAAALLSGIGREPLPATADEEARENRQGFLEFVGALQKVIDRKDSGSEPLDLIPPRIAADKCLDAEAAGGAADPLCAAPAVAESLAQEREFRRADAAR